MMIESMILILKFTVQSSVSHHKINMSNVSF